MSVSQTELVSVVLPVFNARRYVRAAVNSILLQDHREFELLLIDDGSTDGSMDVVADLARDSRVRVVSRENRGLIASLNEGLTLAEGRFVARMDADDISYPSRFSRQLEAFRRQPGLALCGCEYDRILSRGRRMVMRASKIEPTSNTLAARLMFYTAFAHPGVMFNRPVLGEELWYDARYELAEDFDLFRRIARRHTMRLLPESLLAYRHHPKSVTSRRQKPMRRTHLRIVQENCNRAGFRSAELIGSLLSLPGPERIAASAKIMSVLQEDIHGQAREDRPALEEGATGLFHFLRRMLREEVGLWAECRFISAVDRWPEIRRRDRYVLKLADSVGFAGEALHVGFAVADTVRTMIRNPRIADVVPQYAAIMERPVR